jgi:hypothetical protein
MPRKRWWSPLVLALGCGACYHQVVQTGRTPGTTVVDKPWVSTWVFGLVPATEIDVRRECPSGIATVETETSFVNGLVGVVTLGIYTPQHARVTCATRTANLPTGAVEIVIPADASAAQSAAIVDRAAQQALTTHTAVVLRF